MNVLVFDIDGTLARTNRVDGAYFLEALQTVFPGAGYADFEETAEATDTAILQSLCSRHGASYAEVEPIVLRSFMDGLTAAADEDPSAFHPVPGATTVFEAARATGWVPSIATGAWRPSAELKLRVAGIPSSGVPLATSSEHARRVDIIRSAVRDAAAGGEVESVVYVGDGPWDVAACRELAIGFVGVSAESPRDRLLEAGARVVLGDLTHFDPGTVLSDVQSLVPSPEL